MNKLVKTLKLSFINLITAIRLIGAFILPFIYYKHGTSIASVLIIILFITDLIDGFLARKLNGSTFFGCILDAFSDKVLNAVSFLILGLEYNLMFAPIIIEIAILYTNYSTYRYGGNVQSSPAGKYKTAIVDVAVILCFIVLALPTFKINSMFVNKIIIHTTAIINILALIILGACLMALFDYMKKNNIARLNPKSNIIKYEKKKKKDFKRISKELFDIDYYKKHKNESIMKQFYY